MKICRGCQEQKDLESFAKSSKDNDGLQRYCRVCKSNYYQKNKENYKKVRKIYLEKNSEAVKARVAKYQKLNRLKHNERNRVYSKTAREIKSANLARYRAAKDNRTPKWLTAEQLAKIQEYYWLAADLRKVTGEIYHVDHIVPLRGDNVSGLHVPWNLQVLPMDLNCKKSNMLEQMQIAAENGL